MDDDVSCSWQGQAIEALGFLAPAEEWHIDLRGQRRRVPI